MPEARPGAVRLDPADNVAVSLADAAIGQAIHLEGRSVTIREAIPAGHKLALEAIDAAAPVIKFGQEIGRASRPIHAGDWVHSHNLQSSLAPSGGPGAWRPGEMAGRAASPDAAAGQAPAFNGYLRPDGRVGIRNEIWILNTVGCVNQAAQQIALEASRRHAGRCDGIFAFPHPYGCSQVGDDLDAIRRVLAGLARNPNAGGVLIIGLGCENNQLAGLVRETGAAGHNRLRYFNAQEVDDEIESGLACVAELLDQLDDDRRVPVPLGALVLGVKCGGSDGFSSLTANPLVGRISDRVAAAGGSVVLSEVPEMFGAEALLFDRAADEEVHARCVRLIEEFKAYFTGQGVAVDENPSPGNLEGGITTLQEKSLGAVQKGGKQAPVRQVLNYGEQATEPGLVLLESPGNDAVSSTALAASGATLILFTTGRGTPLGFPVPTLKIASNSDLARRKPRWIDFDAGACLAAGSSPDVEAERLLALVRAVASGQRTRNEESGNREIAFWKRGVTL